MNIAAYAFSLILISTPLYAITPGEVPVGGQLLNAPMYGFYGDYRELSELRGTPLIINVWASWCSPCRAEMGSLERIARRYNGKQFNIIGVSTDDDPDAAAQFISQAGLSFDNYHDRNLVLENMLGADSIPLTLLVDSNGRVLKKVRGARQWDSSESIDMIAKTLNIKLK